jgi:hypothetical protein
MSDHAATPTNSGLVQLNDSWYDVLRAFVEKVFPGLGVLYAAFAAIWHWGYSLEVTGTLAALSIFGGVILSLSRKGYTPAETATPVGAFVINTTDVDRPPYRLEADLPLEELEARVGEKITLDVKNSG